MDSELDYSNVITAPSQNHKALSLSVIADEDTVRHTRAELSLTQSNARPPTIKLLTMEEKVPPMCVLKS